MTVYVRFGGGLSDAVGALKSLSGKVQDRTILGLSQVAFDEAQRGAGRHNKTGALFQSLYNRSATPNSRAVGHDLQRAPQAAFINLGTRPHEIRPKNRKALRFVAGGRFVFAKVVKHPGYRGDGYLFKAATVAVQQFASIVDAALREIS